MNIAKQFNYCTHISQFVLMIMFSCKIETKLDFDHLEKHYGSLDKERNRVNYFQYIKISTEIKAEWSTFPKKRKNVTFDKYVDKKYSCPVQMAITFLNYNKPNGTICLFQDEVESSLYLPDAKVYTDSKNSDVEEFYKGLQPVTGYVMNEVDTVVSGYVINKQFYGTIRLFDTRSNYHIIYYLEPIPNLILYNTDELPAYTTTSNNTPNTILFEYLMHADEAIPPGSPLRGKREIPNDNDKSLDKDASDEKIVNTEEDSKSSTVIKTSKKAMKRKTRKSKNPPGSIHRNTKRKIAVNRKVHGNRNLHSYYRKANRTNFNFLPDLFEENVKKRALNLPTPAQLDTVYFNVENTLSEGEDIIETIPYDQKGSIPTDIFDMRRLHSFKCSLCVFIQPNFADKFGYGGGLKIGTAEVLHIISHLNWVFRTIDFNGDGIPEKIGFVIKEVRITDSIVIKEAANKGTLGFVEDIKTIPVDSVFTQCSDQLQTVFKESCCAILGFVFHNMAPSISATYLRGLCSKKNVAIISGFVHAHKISLYDVYREMFHALGHLFGAPHDNPFDLNCWDTSIYRYMNPFTMHPAPQINVGFRPNSMRYTICSKLEISRFLVSTGARCLIEDKIPYCGNGIKDDNEECDCGNPWQCYDNLPEGGLCCGVRNTVVECKKVRIAESCPPSHLWPRDFADKK